MNDTIINIDLPKIKYKQASNQIQKEVKIVIPCEHGKDDYRLRGISRKMLIQRYKTQLYESENGKHENEFLEVTSGAKRSNNDHKSTQRSSFASAFPNNKEKEQNQIRHSSINYRKIRLPKLMNPKHNRNREPIITQVNLNSRQTSTPQRMQLVTFYPSKMQTSSQRIIK